MKENKLTIKQFAAKAAVSSDTVRRWIRERSIQAEKEPIKGFILVWMINENELKKVVK